MISMANIVPSGFILNILPSDIVNEISVTEVSSKRVSFTSSLPLQMSLYFNIFYFPMWLGIECVFYYIKYNQLSAFYKVIIICILVCMSIVEIVRIYLGYAGNLMEKMPELAGHWILTLVIQLPQILFLLFNEATIISVVERISSSFLALFFFSELIFGFLSIRKNMKLQKIRFKLQQIHGDDAYHKEPVYYDNKMFKES